MIAIKAEGLSKWYRLGEYNMLHKRVIGLFQKPKGIWALDDVSFELGRGEALGIIGANGSGKSTLLKILSRVTAPTKGSAVLNGKITSMLEVGTGFHPELTGWENIMLNGVILGMKESEVKQKMDAIVAFSGLEKFLDTPVKRYSTGMYVRLAFSIAAHLDSEMLVVDEVLSVGDAAFQKKSFDKMEESRKLGRTILFVSHNMNAVRSICPQTMLLNQGKVDRCGLSQDIINYYLQESDDTKARGVQNYPKKITLDSRNISVQMESLELITDKPYAEIEMSKPIVLRVEYTAQGQARFSLVLKTEAGQVLFGSLSNNEPNWYGKTLPKGKYITECVIPPDWLNEGVYSATIFSFGQGWSDGVPSKPLLFRTIDDGKVRGDYFGSYEGALRPALKWETMNDTRI